MEGKMTFYQEIAKMKEILRKGWVLRNVGQGKEFRIESVAEHTFSMALLAIQILEKKNLKLDEAKVMKMIAVHDICEIDYGDHALAEKIPVSVKFENEINCVSRIAKEYRLSNILSLWKEFEEGKTEEAKFVKKIDKLDAILQSNVYAEKCQRKELFDEFKENQIEIYNEFFEDIK